MVHSIKRRLGFDARQIKIFYCIFCFIIFCGCHPRSVSETDIIQYAPPTEDTVRLAVDSSLGDAEIVEVVPSDTTAVTVPIIKQETPAPPALIPATKSLQEIYFSQVGVTEATGKNDGPSVERYLRSVGLGKGYAWCAAFVKWSFDSAHVRTKINGAAASCYSKSLAIYQNKKFTTDPRSGDVFTLWYSSLGRIGHTGFFDTKINSTVFMSCEGNTGRGGAVDVGTREGDGVYKKYRSFNATYAICRFTR